MDIIRPSDLPWRADRDDFDFRLGGVQAMTIYFSIDQTPEGGIQLAINDDCGGYRIFGPKYDGRSKTIGRHKLTPRDVEEIKRYLARVGEALS